MKQKQHPSGFKHIDAAGLNQMIADQCVVIVDIRDDASFAAGHIEGSIQLNNQSLHGFIESQEESDAIVVVCYHGHSSQPVAAFLIEQGFNDVYSLDGGYTGWAARCNT